MRDIGINSLKFFTGDGKEILMKKQYSVCWEIIPADPVYSAFIKNPSGHIELYPSNNLNNMFGDIPDSNGYIKTSKIEIKNNMTYIVTLSSFERTSIRFYTSSNVEKTIENFKKSDLEHGYKVSNNNGIYEILFNSDFGYKYFAVYALESDSYRSVKENSNKANVVVDDPGQIRNHVEFYLKDGEEQYLYDSFAIVRTGKSEDILSRIYPTETYYTLNSLCEILFFTYKTVYTSVYTTDNKVREVYESRHSDYISNKVLITVFDGEDYAQSEYNILDIFRPNQLSLINTYYGFKPVVSYDDSSRNNLDFTTVDLIRKNPQDTQTNNSIYEIDADSELFTQVPAINSDMDETIDSTDSFIKKQSSLCYMMSFNIPESQFPYVKYIGQCYMDKVSVGFVQPETIIIYDDSSTPHNEYGYPEIKDPLTNETFRLHFKFQKDSEMSFLTTSDNMHIDKKDNMFMLLYSEKEYPEEAMHMTVGFQSDSEGVFQNVMGIFIRNVETNQDFIIGAILFFIEVEDEDERFRTVLGNFGIPDPIKFPNIFRHSDPDEQGTDWTIVNEKSKELFLSYDQIFPYVGTYKALFNAIKYLGYQDLIFKEWYKIHDKNEKDRYVAIQTYDVSTGNPVKSVLKNYGIEYEEYERYRKLNRLAMIYHMQTIDEDDSEEQLISESGEKYYNHFDIPVIKNVYEYRTDEVLAKLYSVKQWLERYILGVNCYISDINGEGIVLEKKKTVGYTTVHEFKDIQNRGFFTPKCKQSPEHPFMDSETQIDCTLAEFAHIKYSDTELERIKNLSDEDKKTALLCEQYHSARIEDYKDFTFEHFIKYEETNADGQFTKHNFSSNSLGNFHIYESAPIGALTVADEYQFILDINDAPTGSLYEFAASESLNNPIVINDGEILFWDDKQCESLIDEKELPIINIKKGNLRRITGEWSTHSSVIGNIEWTVKPIYGEDIDSMDTYSGNYYSQMKYTGDNTIYYGRKIITKSQITLSPDYSDPLNKPSFKYTTNNKWGLPLFILKNYKLTNVNEKDSSVFVNETSTLREYILEIVNGSIMFRNVYDSTHEKYCMGAEVKFSEPNREDYGEQIITVSYRYMSPRTKIYEFTYPASLSTYTSFSDVFSYLDSTIRINDVVSIPVNRLGKYTVSVNAYDAWNNIFNNKSDDICSIKTKQASIEVILNQDETDNPEYFYRYNLYAYDTSVLKMTNAEKNILTSEISDNPIFPQNYKIYNSEHVLDDNTITYDNISYAIDTPKANDYVILSNLTEQVYECASTQSGFELHMKANNPNKQNVFNELVSLCVYDDNLQKILYETEKPIHPVSLLLPTGSNDSYDGCITLSVADVPTQIKTTYFELINNHNNNINLYVINAARDYIEVKEELDEPYLLQNYVDIDENDNIVGRYCYIPVNFHTDEHNDEQTMEDIPDDSSLRMFYKDMMVKICVDSSMNGKQLFHNETAYRIIDTSTNVFPDDPEKYSCGYIIDGNIDIDYIKHLHNRNVYKFNSKVGKNNATSKYMNPEMSVYMTPVHTDPVKYTLRVNSDAAENVFIYGNYEYYTITTTVNYNQRQLLFDSYFDDTYATNIFRFNPETLKDIWHVQTQDEINEKNLYVYKDYPVTIEKNRCVIARPNIPVPDGVENGLPLIENNEYMTLWKWKMYAVEDNTNWRERKSTYEKILLFESKNKVLSVSPDISGPQALELYCMDKYGNIIKNDSGGNIYIKAKLGTY